MYFVGYNKLILFKTVVGVILLKTVSNYFQQLNLVKYTAYYACIILILITTNSQENVTLPSTVKHK